MDLVEDSTMKWWKGKDPVLLGTALIVGGIAMALVAYASPTPRMHVLPSRLVATDAEPLVVTLRITNPALAPLSVENSGCGCNMTLGFERELRLASLSSAEFSVTIDVSSEPAGRRSALIKLASFVGDRFVPLVAEVEYEVQR